MNRTNMPLLTVKVIQMPEVATLSYTHLKWLGLMRDQFQSKANIFHTQTPFLTGSIAWNDLSLFMKAAPRCEIFRSQ